MHVNTFSLFDLFAAMVTANIAVVFGYRHLRIARQTTDLSFLVSIIVAFGECVLIFLADNVVPAGVPSLEVANGGGRTLFLYRFMYYLGLVFMASLTHFTLRYSNSGRLIGRRVGVLYVLAALGGLLVWTEFFFRQQVEPRCETSDWSCAVPWAPIPGPLMLLYGAVACTLSVVLFCLLKQQPRESVDFGVRQFHLDVVRLGIIALSLVWVPGVVMTACEYVGVDPSVIILALGMTAVAIGLAEEHARSEKEREHVTRRFRSYVDPALVKYVIEHPESERIRSEVRELTVVFTDLEGFTTISERLREGVVELVNEYLKVMTPLIRNHNGYRDKFLGDGMKFFYGAPERNPDHAIHAVSTVLKMDEMMRELNRELATKKRHLLEGFPKLVMRAGVSTGVMVVGDAGTDEASDYTVLGDTVNLGARLETANKATGTRILLSDRTVELIPADLFLVRPVGRLRVVGRTRPVMAYEPLAFTKEATPEQLRCAELTRAMVDCFLRADFAGCMAAERDLEAAMGPSKLGALYRDLSLRYLADAPGVSFSGEIVLAEK